MIYIHFRKHYYVEVNEDGCDVCRKVKITCTFMDTSDTEILEIDVSVQIPCTV